MLKRSNSCYMKRLLALLILVNLIENVRSWENSEFEMFDLVEEVGQNFYEVLGISQEATSKEIKQAYRRLSVKLHPDKNPEPDADVKFRQLVGIYEVLKDPETREAYHTVLRDGLPNWRQPIYYYRRYRKLALWQVVIIVLIIFSVSQYLASWASYWEKRIALKEKVEADRRRNQRTHKAQKEGKKQDTVNEKIDQMVERPSVWNLAPFQIGRFCKYMVIQFPFDIIQLVRQWREEKAFQEAELRQAYEEAEQERLQAEEPKKPRKRKTFEVREKPEGESEVQPSWGTDQSQVESKSVGAKTIVSGGLWTDDDISELIKLCTKFPGGIPGRWENIASVLNRPVSEVTFMAKTVLERLANKPNEDQQHEEGQSQLKVKVKTKGGKVDSLDRLKVENWTAEEQKALENALQLYPKGVSERWEKIANGIPGRSKEECMQRFKYLADLVKKNREKKEDEVEETVAEEEVRSVEESIQTKHETVEEEVELPDPEEEPQKQKKGNKISKKAKRRQKEMERHSSTSSTDPVDSTDWCVVEDDEE